MKEVARRLADMRIDITRELGKQKSVEKRETTTTTVDSRRVEGCVDLMKRWKRVKELEKEKDELAGMIDGEKEEIIKKLKVRKESDDK